MNDIFLNAAANVLPPKKEKSEWGKVVEFECPCCGGKAKAMRSAINGHFRAMCDRCNQKIIE